MSADPTGDEIRDESAPIQPLLTPHPLTRFLPLVVPVIFVVLVICGMIYGVIPMWNMTNRVNKNFEKMRQDSVRAYSRPYQGPPLAPAK